MSDTTGAQIRCSRQVIALESSDPAGECIAAVAQLGNLIAVNIAKSDDASGVFFCAANVRTVTVRAPGAFVIETLAAADHARLMRAGCHQAIEAARALRETLRFEPVAACADACGALIGRFDRLLLMLDGYVIQRPRTKAVAATAALREGRNELACSFRAGDSVACMDDLQYVLLPALKSVRSAF